MQKYSFSVKMHKLVEITRQCKSVNSVSYKSLWCLIVFNSAG